MTKSPAASPSPRQASLEPRSVTPTLVAIGASAGGPAAIAEVLRALPAPFPAPIVIIQHIDARFAANMTTWLNDQSEIPVRLVNEGESPVEGVALFPGLDDHLVLTPACKLEYLRDPSVSVYRPSIDVFFQSIRNAWRGSVVAVLLTGMGRDGAKGLKALRDAGALTLAQDQASSVVYGMPKAAADLAAASEVLPLNAIGPRLAEVVHRGGLPRIKRGHHG